MIKKTLFFSGIIIWGAILLLAYSNQSLSLTLNYVNSTISLSFPTFLLLLAILAALASVFISQANLVDLEKRFKQESRKTERAGIVKEEAQDKVKLLESKIKTLEKALSDALKRD